MIINPHTHTHDGWLPIYTFVPQKSKSQLRRGNFEIFNISSREKKKKTSKSVKISSKRVFLELLREFVDLGVSLVFAENQVCDFKKFCRTLGGRKRARMTPTKSVRLEEITSLLTTSKNVSGLITCRSSENISPKRSI